MAEWNRAVIETAGPKVIDLSASFLDIRQVNDPAAQMAPMQTNRTKEIVNALVLNSVQNQRYMRIGIGAFSIVLAGIIILRIFYDSWRASQLQVKLHPKYVGKAVSI